MFVAQPFKIPRTQPGRERVATAGGRPPASVFASAAERDFQRFVARHGSFKRYLPYPL